MHVYGRFPGQEMKIDSEHGLSRRLQQKEIRKEGREGGGNKCPPHMLFGRIAIKRSFEEEEDAPNRLAPLEIPGSHLCLTIIGFRSALCALPSSSVWNSLFKC